MDDIINQYRHVIYLIRCALNNTKPEKNTLCEIDYDLLRKLCKFHGVAAMAAYVIDSDENTAGIIGGESKKEWHYTYCRSLGRSVTYKDETNQICGAFSKAGIHFTKLKGILLMDYYPKLGMREMSDVDLLIDSDALKKAGAVMGTFGYNPTALDQSNHDVFCKPPGLCFEIHEELFTDYHRNYYDYYINCRDKMITSDSNPYELKFTDEDFYLYQIVHSCKHLHDSGVGLRALTDIYVFLNNFSIDRGYVDRELKTLGIAKEEKILVSLANKLFSPSDPLEVLPLTLEERSVLSVILKSGANGTIEQNIKNKNQQSIFEEAEDISVKDGWVYVKNRVYPKPEAYKKSHPFFYRHRLARPFLVFVRLGESVFTKKGELRNETRVLFRAVRKKK